MINISKILFLYLLCLFLNSCTFFKNKPLNNDSFENYRPWWVTNDNYITENIVERN